MTASEPGHINNLDENQVQVLKDFWLKLAEHVRCGEDRTDSGYAVEFFLAVGSDNPDVVLLRWLRARKWDVNGALQQFLETMKWRHEWGVREFIEKGETDLCEEEIRTGKSYFMGTDRAGRPIHHAAVKLHIKDQFPAAVTEKLTVFTMETGRKLLQLPNESITVLFDMSGFSLKNMDYQHVKFLISLLQKFYPESFALGLVINSPWIFNGCWYIIKPWLDPIVQSKIHFVNNLADLSQYIDPAVLPKRLNGPCPDFNYLPPTEEDLAMLAAFRNDKEGEFKAKEVHREAAKHYLKITDRWAREKETDDLLAERTKATKDLSNAFELLVPYVCTRTHYHRSGMIDEPIFDILYQRIREKN